MNEYLQIFNEFLKVIIWPVTVLGFSYMFRREMQGILGRLSNIKYKDLVASFEKDLRQAEIQVESVSSVKKSAQLLPSSIGSKDHRLLNIAEVAPRSAVLESWLEVEKSIEEVAKANNLFGSPNSYMAIQLKEKGLMASHLFDLYNKLRNLRNQAVHADEFNLESSEGERYILLSLYLINELRKIHSDSSKRLDYGNH